MQGTTSIDNNTIITPGDQIKSAFLYKTGP
jgi:hypothetical protein